MAKGDSIKELTKTSKKLRPSQSQTAGEDTTPPAPGGMGGSAIGHGGSLPLEERHRDHDILGRRKADAE